MSELVAKKNKEIEPAALGTPDPLAVSLDRLARYAIDRHQTLEAARQSERLARSTVNSLSSHIAILDENGRIISVNTAWRRFAGENGMSSPSHGEGMSYLDVCDHAVDHASDHAEGRGDEDARAAAAGIRAVLGRHQDLFELEYPCHSPDEQRWFLLRATPFEGDGPTRVVVCHENITSRKLAQRLASEQSGLRAAVSGMEQVLGVVGHELRTPLAALRAIGEFLAIDGARNTAQADRFLHSLSDQVSHMSDTVENLLEAARLNSGRANWNFSKMNVARVIEDAIASIRLLVDDRRVRMESHLHRPGSAMLGDSNAIRRLIVNLLSNAQKFTEQGRIGIRSRRYTDARGAWIKIVVTDTGCGIARELSTRLGEAFALNSGMVGDNHVSGTGLGLSICKGIAAAHGGSIRVRSVVGRGTAVIAQLRTDLQSPVTGEPSGALSKLRMITSADDELPATLISQSDLLNEVPLLDIYA